MCLRFQFGVIDAFAIGTTYEQWRVFRLPSDDEVTGPRLIDASPVFDAYQNAEALSYAICATLQCTDKANIIPQSPYPPVSLDPHHAYVRVDAESWGWVTRKILKLDYAHVPLKTCKSFLLLRDLGVGLHGHAWLACSETGRTCVIKVGSIVRTFFGASGQLPAEGSLEMERLAWGLANPRAPPAALCTIMTRPALRMAYAHPVNKGDCDAKVEAAVSAMAHNGVWHRDLHWRHVGMFNDNITFFDFGKCMMNNLDIATAEAAMLRDLCLVI